LVTKSDPKKRPTIWEHLTKFDVSLNSAGRLDFNSEGLLIISNDGDFLYQLTHPKHEVWKVYAVKVRGVPSSDALSRLKKGVELDDGRTAPAKVSVTKQWENATWLEIEIREGKYRQVRRMCEKVGHQVTKLRRIAIGPVKLGRLGHGKWRKLNSYEVRKLKEASAT
jgi:23S rRNA pseudouridine2605 synthase